MNHNDTTDTTCQLSVNACVVLVVSLWLESCRRGKKVTLQFASSFLPVNDANKRESSPLLPIMSDQAFQKLRLLILNRVIRGQSFLGKVRKSNLESVLKCQSTVASGSAGGRKL